MEKKESGIDKYFQSSITGTVPEESEERRSVGRRVSFAPAAQIRYVPVKDGDKSESSSLDNMSIETQGRLSMDITVNEMAQEEIESFSLQGNDSLPMCEEEREKNFIMEDSDSSFRDRMSISNTREMEHTMEYSVIKAHEPTVELTEIFEDAREKSVEMVGEMLSEIMGGEINNSLGYDTVNVEEMMQTRELKKIAETESSVSMRKVPSKKIKEILSEAGIRFLDNLSTNARRETLSRIRNQVPESKVLFFKHYLKKRINLYLEFSSELLKEIEGKRKEVEILEVSVDEEVFNREDRVSLTSHLRQLKSESRRRSKSMWHLLRLERENLFILQVTESLREMEGTLSRQRREREEVEQQVGRISTSGARERERELNEGVGRLHGMTEEEVERFMTSLEEQEKVLASCEEELGKLREELLQREEEYGKVSLCLEREESELRDIAKRTVPVEVTEEDYQREKERRDTAEKVLEVKIKKITEKNIIYEVEGIELSLGVGAGGGESGSGSEGRVVSVAASSRSNTTINVFLAKSIPLISGVINGKLSASILSINRYVMFYHSLEKELKYLGISLPYKVEIRELSLVITVTVKRGKRGPGVVEVAYGPGSTAPSAKSNMASPVQCSAGYGALLRLLRN